MMGPVLHAPHILRTILAALLLGSGTAPLVAEPPAAPEPLIPPPGPVVERPRVLLTAATVRQMQIRCGLSVGSGDSLAAHVADYRRIAQWVDQNIDLPLPDGGLYLPALMHLLTGQRGKDDRFTHSIDRELARRRNVAVDFDDVAAALDWCWDALDPGVRRLAADDLARVVQPLAPTDSPLNHALFHPKLCSLAAAIALKEAWPDGAPERQKMQDILAAGQRYIEEMLPRFVLPLRGIAPACGLQADFEADVVFAAELWDVYSGGTYWPRIADAMSQACDLYYWSDSNWRGLFGGFVHDFGTRAPVGPGEAESALAHGVADILAHRTGSPIAGWYSQLGVQRYGDNSARALNRRWIHMLHAQTAARPDPAPRRLACNFDNGWIVMRSSWRPGATVVTFDAGQPFWLARQHYDAGQFQIIHKGRLAVDSGDDVSLEATPARGGRQGLGDADDVSFDDYAAATIAHNCLILADPRDRLRRDNRNWDAAGNQRTIEGDWRPDGSAISSSDRQTGRLIAFETNDHYSFAWADLARAYHTRTTKFYDRQLLFVGGTYLFVIDRVTTERPDVTKAWVVHVPSRPQIAGADLDPQFRRLGSGNAAGAWLYIQPEDWLTSDAADGRLYVRTLLPARRQWSVVGGPFTSAVIPGDTGRKRSYVGSSADGFEYWIAPASMRGGKNAWFRLGNPVDLGAAFGTGAGWGRLEVEPSDKTAETLFVHLLVPQDRTAAPPDVQVRIDADTVRLVGPGSAGLTYEITLTPRAVDPGRVRARRGETVVFDRVLTSRVQDAASAPAR